MGGWWSSRPSATKAPAEKFLKQPQAGFLEHLRRLALIESLEINTPDGLQAKLRSLQSDLTTIVDMLEPNLGRNGPEILSSCRKLSLRRVDTELRVTIDLATKHDFFVSSVYGGLVPVNLRLQRKIVVRFNEERILGVSGLSAAANLGLGKKLVPLTVVSKGSEIQLLDANTQQVLKAADFQPLNGPATAPEATEVMTHLCTEHDAAGGCLVVGGVEVPKGTTNFPVHITLDRDGFFHWTCDGCAERTRPKNSPTNYVQVTRNGRNITWDCFHKSNQQPKTSEPVAKFLCTENDACGGRLVVNGVEVPKGATQFEVPVTLNGSGYFHWTCDRCGERARLKRCR